MADAGVGAVHGAAGSTWSPDDVDVVELYVRQHPLELQACVAPDSQVMRQSIMAVCHRAEAWIKERRPTFDRSAPAILAMLPGVVSRHFTAVVTTMQQDTAAETELLRTHLQRAQEERDRLAGLAEEVRRGMEEAQQEMRKMQFELQHERHLLEQRQAALAEVLQDAASAARELGDVRVQNEELSRQLDEHRARAQHAEAASHVILGAMQHLVQQGTALISGALPDAARREDRRRLPELRPAPRVRLVALADVERSRSPCRRAERRPNGRH